MKRSVPRAKSAVLEDSLESGPLPLPKTDLPREPFRGIESFRLVDGPIFFGRRVEARKLLRLVTMYRGAMLFGESGAGKSSLLKAGFIPDLLRDGFMPEILRVRPRLNEELSLERISLREDDVAPFLPSNLTREDNSPVSLSCEGLRRRLKSLAIRGVPLLIFDQFEEFVTLFDVGIKSDRERKQARKAKESILALLFELLRDPNANVKLLFVFREDYFAKLQSLLNLCPELMDQGLRLLSPTVTELETIISGPFSHKPSLFNKQFSNSLTDRLAASIEARNPDGFINLSEVQIACLTLWRDSDPEKLFDSRNVQGLIEDYLVVALQDLGNYRSTAIAILDCLVTADQTRNVVSRGDLIGRVAKGERIPEQQVEEALAALVSKAKLVREEFRSGINLYEIVSEFLIPWIGEQKAERLRATVPATLETWGGERQFLSFLESADVEEFSQMLRRPTAGEQRLLAIYFGVDRLERLRSMALRSARKGNVRGNVVVIHGMMASQLTAFPPNEKSDQVWLSIPRISTGGMGFLQMTPEARSLFDVRPTGFLKKWYSEMLLGLAMNRWNVRAFFYDWRLDFANSADELRSRMDAWFGPTAPVNLVAHSTGGLVARTFILRHTRRWNKGGKLIMLGSPNHGSFAAVQAITGALDVVRKLSLVDRTRSQRELLGIINSFPSFAQTLPSPLIMPTMESMYRNKTLLGFGVSSKLLDRARQSHEQLAKVVDGARMTYIAGCNQMTKVDVADWTRLDNQEGYKDSWDGDGTVPHLLGFLKDGAKRIPTFFVECEHGSLPDNRDVVAATLDILAGEPCTLPQLPSRIGAPQKTALLLDLAKTRERAEEQMIEEFGRRVRGNIRGTRAQHAAVTADEIQTGELLVSTFLSASATNVILPKSPAKVSHSSAPTFSRSSIRIRLALQGLEKTVAKSPTVDAIAVGHYMGVAPQNAELALDRAISERGDLLLTSLHRRGVVSGTLCNNFQLPDPRDSRRVIILAGMGEPGTCGEAELAVLVRELVWILGRSGRKHLQTVLIGAGAGNIRVADAVRAWLRGVSRALFDAAASGDPRLHTITFVERSAANFLSIHRALVAAQTEFAVNHSPLDVDYTGPDRKTLAAANQAADAEASVRGVDMLHRSLDRYPRSACLEPNRFSIRLVRGTSEVAAITAEAVMPKRITFIDSLLISEANDQLPEATDPIAQSNHGRLLGRLLIPDELWGLILRPGVPLIVTVDASTARVHWEMVALKNRGESAGIEQSFLGTACGLTRQLRTNFVRLPEPPLLTSQSLRVLIIADPAADAPLPGAQEEGEAVATIFEEFGRVFPVEVVRLFGPGEATRVAVLDQLINSRFDLLHYAGHCYFNSDDPMNSGWLFNSDPLQVLTADELGRIDRVPRFVFSNACEAGITPDRAAEQNALLAPCFAEAFFVRGVSNYICAAWPVDDVSALTFAQRFYRGMLGVRDAGLAPEAAYEAMTAARRAAAALGGGGMQTWGAYQHYGDPNFRMVATPFLGEVRR